MRHDSETRGGNPMTKRRMAQYLPLKREIAMLEDQIATAGDGSAFVTDYAKDYSTGHPRVITLRGYGTQKVPAQSLRLIRCIDECRAIEDFIAGLDDSMMRQLLTRRYIEGRSVEEVAEMEGRSDRQVRRRIDNFFEKMSVSVR